MANQGITLTINAETAEAAAKLQQFFNGLNENVAKLSGVGSLLEGLGARLAAVFSAGALVEFTRSAINTAEQMGNMAEKTGLALSTLNALREQAHQLGIPFESLNFALGMFSDKIFMAIRQGGIAAQGFRDLGIKLVDANGAIRSTDEVLSAVADKFKAMPDGPMKAAAATELFGRSGRELIPILNQGAAGMERMRAEGGGITPEMVRESTQFNRAIRDLEYSFEMLFMRLAGDVLPTLQKLADWFKNLTAAGGGLGETIGPIGAIFAMEFTKGLIDGILKAGTFFGEVFIETALAISRAFDSFLTAAINRIILWWKGNDFLTRVFGEGPGLVTLSDSGAQAATQIAQMKEGANILKDAVDKFFDKGIAAAKGLVEASVKVRQNLQAALQWAVSGPQAALGALFGTGAGPARPKAPQSEEAKKLIEEIEKAYAQATQGRHALLEREEAQLKQKISDEIQDRTKAEEEKAKVTEMFAAKHLDLVRKAEDEEYQLKIKGIQAEMQLVEKDPTLTEVQKKHELLGLLVTENDLIHDKIVLTMQLRDQTDPQNAEEIARLNKEIEALKIQLGQNVQNVKQNEPLNFGGEMDKQFTTMLNNWTSWSKQFAQTFSSVFQTATTSISGNLTKLMMGTETWHKALKDIGTTIMTKLISSIIEMGVQYVLTQVLIRGAMLATAAVTAAIAPAQMTQNEQVALSGGLAGIGTSAAEGGWVGILIYLGVLAAAVAACAGIMGGFAEGGFTGAGGRYEPAGLVHRGEFVFSAPSVQRLGAGNLDRMHRGYAGGGMVGAASRAAASRTPVHVHYWDNGEQMRQHIAQNPDVQHEILDLVGRKAHTFR